MWLTRRLISYWFSRYVLFPLWLATRYPATVLERRYRGTWQQVEDNIGIYGVDVYGS